ncbi:hypothetical protein LCGC14_0399030 [marine sediment metagenome]|uniref:Uncharacterized protein n=1 Tax=marine sediment metagenome TaxID=412755 RepID=A0A0F9TFH0_9ZZZZ
MEIYFIPIMPRTWQEFPTAEKTVNDQRFEDMVDKHIKKYLKAWKDLANL